MFFQSYSYILCKEKKFRSFLVLESFTFRGEKANVTSAFVPKFTSTAMLIPLPLSFKGNISDIISQLIGPKDNCKIDGKYFEITT